MKIAKTVKRFGTAALLTLGAVSFYESSRARDAYEEMKANYHALMGKMADIRESLDALSGKIAENGADSRGKRCEDRQASDKKATADEDVNENGDAEDIDGCGRFTVREYKGILGIFDESGRLLREEDVMVASLSPSDRQSLELGIRVETEAELERLLEEWN